MRTFWHPSREDLSLPAIFHALSDPLRLRIVFNLAVVAVDVSCGDIDEAVARSTLSHHFKVLREAGVTRSTPRGTRLMIGLRRADLDARFPGLLDAILRVYAAEQHRLGPPDDVQPVELFAASSPDDPG